MIFRTSFWRKLWLSRLILLWLCLSLPVISQAQVKQGKKPKSSKKASSKKSSKNTTTKTKPPAKPKTTAPKTGVTVAPSAPDNASKGVNILDSILKNNAAWFGNIVKDPNTYHAQIIYTRIDRDKTNKATFTNYTFRLNKDEFFYPASMVKMPACALALEKVEELAKTGLRPNTHMFTDKAYACQSVTNRDPSAADGYASIAQYIRRMLLVSDNVAYSRIYEFLTPEYIYKKLSSKGYPNARIRIRFDVDCLGQPNNYTNPIRFINDSGRVVYQQPARFYAADHLSMPVKNTVKRIDFKDPNTSIQKDFTHSNFLSVSDMHEILKSILFPAETPANKAFRINPTSRKLLWRYMQMMPYESDFPAYPDRNAFHDSYKKYLYYGQDSSIIHNKQIRIFNVVGQSYGYTTDCAYIVDFEHHTEFMVTATFFVQEPNGVIDGTDETYNQVVMPFFKHLGQVLYNYELQRPRKNTPNLLEFKF